MDAGVATLLAGIGSGIIAGSIGVVSAVLSYRMAQRQAERDAIENERNRSHQELQIALPRRLAAAEVVWKCLFKLEHDGDLSSVDIDN